jgi:hypothetical protein
MDEQKAIFGSPSIWDSVFQTHENIFRAIESLRATATELVSAVQDSPQELVQVQASLASICSESMLDVLLLAGNNRGAGAMKIARGMFEISVISNYLEKNPSQVRDYVDFSLVEAWRHLQTVERYSPGRVPPDLMNKAEAEFNRVKSRFSNIQGRVQFRWNSKSLKQMAEEIGLLNLYEVAYGPASELHHLPFTGIVGHDLNWLQEALFIAHGSLLGTVLTLFNLSYAPGTENEFRLRLDTAISEFKHRPRRP